MNIDERLEAISTQLELLTHMQADTERRFQENERRFQENERRFQENERRFEKVVDLLAEVGAGIRALTRVAQLHEERITRLEDRPAN